MVSKVEVINNYPGIKVKSLPVKELIRKLLQDEGVKASELNVIFVDDAFLKALHHQYLNENSVTDVITFNLSEIPGAKTEGEIYISVERAVIQAQEFSVSTDQEIARLIVHGLLHLKGYDDCTQAEQRKMRAMEDFYLKKYNNIFRHKLL